MVTLSTDTLALLRANRWNAVMAAGVLITALVLDMTGIPVVADVAVALALLSVILRAISLSDQIDDLELSDRDD